MKNDILKHRMAVMNNIAKSFGYEKSEDLLEKAEDNDIEKAKHQDGDTHPNGKWVWVSSANGGRGDWRTQGGHTHNKTNDNKFNNTFKDARTDAVAKKMGWIKTGNQVSEKDIQISQNPNKSNDNYKLTLKNGNIEISAYSDDYTGKVPDGYSSSPNHSNAFRGYEITINANGKKTDYVNKDMKQFNSKTVVASKDVKQIMTDLAKKGSSSTSGGSGSAGNTGLSNASSSYFSKLSNSLIEKYSKKKESVSLSDIEEFYEDFLRDRSQEPTRKAYANEAKKTYDAIVANWNKKPANPLG